MNEASKAYRRRKTDPRFLEWFRGEVLDIGCGDDLMPSAAYPLVTAVVGYDRILGNLDAMTLPEVRDESFDVVHSSHCLEHLEDPWEAIHHWLRVLRPGGRMIVTVPDWELYEQCVWPSTFNTDHRHAFSLRAHEEPHVVSLDELLGAFDGLITLELAALRGDGFDPAGERRDQSLGACECAIEFVLRKNGTSTHTQP